MNDSISPTSVNPEIQQDIEAAFNNSPQNNKANDDGMKQPDDPQKNSGTEEKFKEVSSPQHKSKLSEMV